MPETKKTKNTFPMSKIPNYTRFSVLSTKIIFSVREFTNQSYYT